MDVGSQLQAVSGLGLRFFTHIRCLTEMGYEVKVIALRTPNQKLVETQTISVPDSALNIKTETVNLPERRYSAVGFWLVPCLNRTKAEWFQPYTSLQVTEQVRHLIDSDTEFVLFQGEEAAVLGLAIKDIGRSFKAIYDLNDITFVKAWRHLKQLKFGVRKLLYLAQLPATLVSDFRCINRFQTTLVCSQTDEQLLNRFALKRSVVSIPNVFAVKEVRRRSFQPVIGLIGTLKYEPNFEAARFIAKQIVPAMRREGFKTHTLIAGEVESTEREQLTDPDVTCLGYLDNAQTFWDAIGVFICPLFVGGGTRLKLIESAFQGVPIIASQIAAEGLGFIDQKHFLLAESVSDYVTAFKRLTADPSLYQQLSMNAYTHVKANFGHNSALAAFKKALA
jgi:hypothetical protein